MAKNSRNMKYSSRELRSARHLRPSSHCSFKRVASQVPTLAATEKCAWKDAICPVCIECPHDAVLLLCSSHDKGCRPYVCGTDFLHSNCLEQLMESCRSPGSCDDPGSVELKCPLCRGEVKGYTLVEPAREQLNRNRRSCMQDGCSYIGSYRQLCKHTRKKHPSAKPRAVDPLQTYKWRRLLFRTLVEDMICATSSSLLQRLLSLMLQYEELMSTRWPGDDHVGATFNVAGL
ncbi:uncharacterized protein [Lolium perenne]|uniref:uncharacterized protein n=1 Tax=Lolium perenne TaxID=4522 RepID=UPI0021F5764D|nr:uncharacterized protein LOC127301793 [Lolium perenne]XP_051188027.1 uncharacterized protein LOC127301793 [Lolium perenne]XP_051188028.1 uncharacterized protein LOC127301793 [Lolium perenne]